MLGRTHVTLGLMLSLLVVPLLGTSLTIGKFNLPAIIVSIIGALLPDLDMGTSALGAKFGFIKAKHIKKIWIAILTLTSIVTIIFLKDTPVFYGIAFIIFLGFVFADKFARKGYYTIRNFVQSIVGISIILFSYYYQHYVLVFVGIILILLLFSKHRGLSHSIVFLVGSTFAVRKISLFYGDVDYSMIFAVSMVSHLLGDMLTKSGIGLWVPFNDKRIKFPYTIKTGGKVEKLIFTGALFAIFNILKGLQL
ncbi:metal-dependent hydrolase [Alkaliphilus sp. MSJ-5]|uniref:Metal-dependent hydrolase n=1 Tax=Alkaliphilus flagellatus TaxID=2841507 RepID=A0ABS6G3V0_9FIRM|nr:metal-dependent hydrolase [Alkaliphilus flagellatus]MBU5677157.1 metal-dependent hydrolase [Alkaliphilus flagellatus]